MRIDRRRFAALLGAGAAAWALAGPTHAQQPGPKAVAEVPMLDPWVPPEQRAKSLAAPMPQPTRGAALAAQVEAKLRARFEAAAGPGGTLTRTQAQAAGLGHIARHFAAIDVTGAGTVTFEDYRRFLALRAVGNRR